MGRFNAWKERVSAFRLAVESLAAELPPGSPAWKAEVLVHQGKVQRPVTIWGAPQGGGAIIDKLPGLVQALIEGSALRFGRVAVHVLGGRLLGIEVTERIIAGEDDRLGRLLDPGDEE